MIFIKTDREIELMRQSNRLLSATLAELVPLIQPGVTTIRLDQVAESYIRDHGGIPGFKGYNGFPNTLCVSINDQVVHGIPSQRTLKEGDIVSIDCGVYMNGYHGDSAFTFPVGEVDEDSLKLLRVTRESLYLGIEQAVSGNRLGDIGCAIQQHCESNGFSVVREMVGHGIGKDLHEAPEVPNYGKKGYGTLLKSGMTIAIEPMINMGKRHIVQEQDGWTIRTSDHSRSAHFEHSVVIRDDKAEILSDFDVIDKALSNK
ncbi:MAG: type I methionyl aminopeptidase [Bacteroidales bacterium]|nr:type I methionyl aminopeptidase [Bacteroidales bacterium]